MSDSPALRMKGRFSLYDTADGGLHIAYQEDGSEDTQHFEIPGHLLKLGAMMGNGKINPMELLKMVKGGKVNADATS